MKVVNIQQLGDEVVLYFGSEGSRINAYTLASSLVAFADAAKAVNAQINPGYEVEIVIEALGKGSFRAKVKALYKSTHNLFSSEPIKSIAIAIIACIIYDHTFAPDHDVKVTINDGSVMITQGERQIVVSRDVYDAAKDLKKSPEVYQPINAFFKSLDRDPAISGVGFEEKMNDAFPPMLINKDEIHEAALLPEIEIPNQRVITERAEVHILRAILEKSRRRWEFSWRGNRISAPVTDQQFYSEFFAHRVQIAPGDTLDVELKVKQSLDASSGIYVNIDYEVTKVFQHKPKVSQMNMADEGPSN